jgi:heat shock protein HtpX
MYSQINANKRRTWLIMIGFAAIIGALGWVVSNLYREPYLLYVALAVGAIYALIQYFAAAKLALAMSGAHEVNKKDVPRLYRVVENLCIETGLPTPKIYVIDDRAPNAFATGRDPQHSVVAVTQGLLDIMDDKELEGVLAHELGHVRNYDIRVMMIVFGLVSAIGLISDILMRLMWFRGDSRRQAQSNPAFLIIAIIAAILAPFIAMLVQLAVSRRREYLADSTSALTTRYPEGLISALEKIRDHGSVLKHQNTATAHFYIANPLKTGTMSNLFSTHPPIEDRIARLRKMETHL